MKHFISLLKGRFPTRSTTLLLAAVALSTIVLRAQLTMQDFGKPLAAHTYQWASNGWQADTFSSDFWTYDAQCLATNLRQVGYNLVSNVPFNTWQHNYTNSNGVMIVDISQSWDSTLGTWLNQSKQRLSYTIQGKRDTAITETWFNGTWNPQIMSVSSYDGNGYLLRSINYKFQNGNWVLQSRNSYQNNTMGKVLTQLVESWDVSTNAWQNESQVNYIYNASNKLIESATQYWVSGNWAFNNLSSKQLHRYNNVGKAIASISLTWNTSTNVFDSLVQQAYDYQGGFVSTVTSLSWNRTLQAWQNTTKSVIIQGCNPTRVSSIEESGDWHIFPNPSDDNFNIVTTFHTLPASCTISDILGRCVMKFELIEPSTHIVHLLHQGHYFLKIQAKDGSNYSGRIVVK